MREFFFRESETGLSFTVVGWNEGNQFVLVYSSGSGRLVIGNEVKLLSDKEVGEFLAR